MIDAPKMHEAGEASEIYKIDLRPARARTKIHGANKDEGF